MVVLQWGAVSYERGYPVPGKACHMVDFEGFVPSKFGGQRDQICTTYGPQINRGRQVDFRWKDRTPPCGSDAIYWIPTKGKIQGVTEQNPAEHDRFYMETLIISKHDSMKFTTQNDAY